VKVCTSGISTAQEVALYEASSVEVGEEEEPCKLNCQGTHRITTAMAMVTCHRALI